MCYSSVKIEINNFLLGTDNNRRIFLLKFADISVWAGLWASLPDQAVKNILNCFFKFWGEIFLVHKRKMPLKFEQVWMHLEHLDAFGRVWMHLDAFGQGLEEFGRC